MITILVSAWVLVGCGGAGAGAGVRLETPSSADRAAILRATDTAFFTSTGAPPDLRIRGLRVAASGAVAWARETFSATPKAPAATAQGVSTGRDTGLLRQVNGGSWSWVGYLAGSCRTVGRAVPAGVARLLALPPVCSSGGPTPSAAPTASAAPVTGAVVAKLSAGDLDTMLSLFVSAKNSGPSGQVLSPSDVVVSTAAPPLAAQVAGGREWALVTYVAASGAPQPLTGEQLEGGAGTAFFTKLAGRQWTLSGLAGTTFCTGAAQAQIPPPILTLWHHPC